MQASEPLGLTGLSVEVRVARGKDEAIMKYEFTPKDLKLPLGVAGSGLQRMVYEMLMRGLATLKEK